MTPDPVEFDADVLGHATDLFDVLMARIRPTLPKIERSYVTIGDIDFPTTCTQFVVSARQIYGGLPSSPVAGPIVGGFLPLSLELGVAYAKQWPIDGGGVLSPGDEDKAAKKLLAECDVVINAVINAWLANEISSPCGELSIGPIVYVGPIGAISGVTLTVTKQLN